MSFYLLFLHNFITSFFKKRFCCNRSVRCNIYFSCLLKLIANSSSNSLSLIICMNKKAVQIACIIYISKTYNNPIINRNNAEMLL